MIKRILRAKELFMNRGARGFLAQLLRYVAHKIETATWMSLSRIVPSDSDLIFARFGRLNGIGAVSARTIPDNINRVITVPLADSNQEIEFDKIAIIAHIFYPEITSQLLGYLENLPIPYGLFITTDSDYKRSQILSAISKLDIHPIEIEIRIVPNRGRDIAPKYIAFSDVYSRYPAFLHIHSKQSLHAGHAYANWRDYLLHALLGNKEIVESNLKLLSRDGVGIVYPEHAAFIKPVINWGFDFPIARELLSRVGITLDVYNILEFPSGSMYWGRSNAIRDILDLHLNYDDFPEEDGQIDGTLAHAIERSLLLFAENAGYQWIRINTSKSNSSSVQQPSSSFEPISTSTQAYVPTIQRNYYETLRIQATPRFDKRKRLNLLVPSLRASDIFGGIDTALKIYKQICDVAGDDVDFRVIVTDAAVPDELPKMLDGYEIQKLGNESGARHTVVDATNRLDLSLEVTKNDVFIATAWWTALNAFRLHDFQQAIFLDAPKVVYLIQDFEPGFYGWSTKYALAESTYRRPLDTIAIFNSEELEQYFSKYFSLDTKSVLPYQVNDRIDQSLRSLPREKIILFYSRPSAVRNCFEVGIDGLNLWARRYPDRASEWKIFCIGETFPMHRVGELQNVVITGKMPLEVYGELLSKASVGISLMISPHPSYPPLEMAYAGIQTITNRYECKDISQRSGHIHSVDGVTPEEVASAIELAVLKSEKHVGQITQIRCPIVEIYTGAQKFSPEQVLRWLNL